jgi:hypothetical protein
MSPACEAVMEQFPTASSVTVFATTVQMEGEPDVKVTGKLELEFAEIVTWKSCNTLLIGAPKSIV